MKTLKLANFSNGLVYDHDHVCYFQSQHGHNKKMGYFRIDAISHDVIIHLLKGGNIEIIDATGSDKEMSDALKFGVPTWCIVFNRAINSEMAKNTQVCPWQTKAILSAGMSNIHKPLVQTIRKLIKYYGYEYPAILGDNVKIKCYKSVNFDDKPDLIKAQVSVKKNSLLVRDDQIRSGRLTLKGTRLTISQILSEIAEGDVSLDEFADDFELNKQSLKDMFQELSSVLEKKNVIL